VAKIKVMVEMDENWVWWVAGENGPEVWEHAEQPKLIEVDEEWLERLKVVSAQYHQFQTELHEMYTKQRRIKRENSNIVGDVE